MIFAPVCTILNLVAQLSAKKRGTRVYGRYYYSGVFARYCELLYSYYQDDALSIIDSYKWALGDIDGDGSNTQELIIQHPDGEYGMNFDIYTIEYHEMNPYPTYVGTIYNLYEPTFYSTAATSYNPTLFAIENVGEEEVVVSGHTMSKDENGNYTLSSEKLFEGYTYEDGYNDIFEENLMLGIRYGKLREGISINSD